MIPVLGIPFVNRSELLHRMLESVDVPVERLVIINNGPSSLSTIDTTRYPNAVVIRPGRNLGVAASWNLICKATPFGPWWAFSSVANLFEPGALARLETAIETHDLVLMRGLSAFGLHARALEQVGWFDENYVPAYYEDDDYVWRCQCAGLPITAIGGAAEQEGSSTINSDNHLRSENSRTFPENRDYYKAKWGGLPHNERFRTPFDSGVPVSEWTLDYRRLARLSWR